MRRVGLRGPLLLFLECSPETVCREAEGLFLGRQTRCILALSFLPLLPLALVIWGHGWGGHCSGGLVR